jgi:hypothetical protein
MTEHALAMLVKPDLFLDLIPMRDPHGYSSGLSLARWRQPCGRLQA